MKKAVILIAHGSKRTESNEEFIKLAKKVKHENETVFHEVEYAFLELALPSIEDAIEKLHEEGMDEVYLYPYFLNSGKHVAVDIPNIVNEMQLHIKDMKIELLKHFGDSSSITQIISNDLKSFI